MDFIGLLPEEVAFLCLLDLDYPALQSASSVCQRWRCIISEKFWKRKLLLDQHLWKCIFNDSAVKQDWKIKLALSELVPARPSALRVLRSLFPASTVATKSRPNVMVPASGSESRDRYRALWQHNIPRKYMLPQTRTKVSTATALVPIIGDGLETSCKKLLYAMMWQKEACPFEICGMRPGTEGLGSGVTFQVGHTKMDLCAIYRTTERSIFQEVNHRPAWKTFFTRATGFIFLFDGKGTLDSNCLQLEQLARTLGERNRQRPLLVLAADPEATAYELAEKLHLDALGFGLWSLHHVTISGDKLEGVPAALTWLADAVQPLLLPESQ